MRIVNLIHLRINSERVSFYKNLLLNNTLNVNCIHILSENIKEPSKKSIPLACLGFVSLAKYRALNAGWINRPRGTVLAGMER